MLQQDLAPHQDQDHPAGKLRFALEAVPKSSADIHARARGQTQYYGLSQWEAADKVERVDFNSDNAKIDGALHALAEQAGRKADKSTVTNLSSVVSQKADETALTAAEKRVSALEKARRTGSS